MAELSSDVSEIDPLFQSLSEKGSFIDRLYIPTRYPSWLPDDMPSGSFHQKDAAEAVQAAKEIIETVKKKA